MTDDALGRLVRETWVKWAEQQPDVADHPSWLVGWDDLPERDREVDRLIGRAVADAAIAECRCVDSEVHPPEDVFDGVALTALRARFHGNTHDE